ncbi:MAG: M48 family metalloprotease [Treponema sp.]|jgi:predicted Zn-dependent protease|nr:M48 family metalloprotease [Treponema sp.]
MKKVFGILLCVLFSAVLGAQGQAKGQGQQTQPQPQTPPQVLQAQARQGGASSAASKKGVPGGDITNAFAEMDRAFEDTGDEELTQEDEYFLGRAVAAQVLSAYQAYDRDPAMVSYLNNICQAIVINSSRPDTFNGYHVGILNTKEINAIATPGGHIFVTRGLLECADSEDALAAIIAHEVAHIQLHHAASIIADQQLANDLSQVAGRAAAMASRGSALKERTALFGRSIGVMVNTLFKNGFAQEQELEADATAAGLLKSAGYDPSALIVVLRTLEKLQPLHPGGFNTTHPSPAVRIASLKNIPAGSRVNASRNARFASFQRRLKAIP